MKKPSSRVSRSAKTGRFVLTSQRAEKISAVEGLKLTKRMGAILVRSADGKLTGDEARALIKAQARKK